MQQYELIIRNRKISRCNGCLNEFDRKNSKFCIVGRNEYDWYVNVDKQENTKMYKLGRQNRYYCTRKQCILARRPFLNVAEIDTITKERKNWERANKSIAGLLRCVDKRHAVKINEIHRCC